MDIDTTADERIIQLKLKARNYVDKCVTLPTEIDYLMAENLALIGFQEAVTHELKSAQERWK